MKNKIIAIVGGTIALFGLGYLIYEVLQFDAMNGAGVEAIKGELNIPVIILMEVLYATLLTIIFSKYTQIKSFAAGAQAGLIIGLFLGGCQTMEWFATTSDLTDLTGVITGATTFGVRFAVAGGIIGWALGNSKE